MGKRKGNYPAKGGGRRGREQASHERGRVTQRQAMRLRTGQKNAAAAIAENPFYFLLYTAGIIFVAWAVKWLIF